MNSEDLDRSKRDLKRQKDDYESKVKALTEKVNVL